MKCAQNCIMSWTQFWIK